MSLSNKVVCNGCNEVINRGETDYMEVVLQYHPNPYWPVTGHERNTTRLDFCRECYKLRGDLEDILMEARV